MNKVIELKVPPQIYQMSTPTLKRTFERVVRMPIRKAGVQDRIERALSDELDRRKAA